MAKNIVAVSLFSGAGGLDIASCMAGVPVISSTDFDSDCIRTLKENKDFFGDTEIFEGDLHKIDSDVFRKVIDKKNPDKFIVIGGAPCQPFSKAGYWVTNQVRRGINDPRATLVNEYLRVVTDLLPDGFVFENVESLMHPTNKVIIDRFIEIIEECGYKYKIVRANALEYGVPQKKEIESCHRIPQSQSWACILEKTIIQKHMCTFMFTAALITQQRYRNNLNVHQED